MEEEQPILTGFNECTFNGVNDRSEFILDGFAKEIREYTLDEDCIRKIDHRLDFNISRNTFDTFFRLYRKTKECENKYGKYQSNIDLNNTSINYRKTGQGYLLSLDNGIVTSDNTANPSRYLLDDSFQLFMVLSAMFDYMIECDHDQNNTFYFAIRYSRKGLVYLRRTSAKEILPSLFILYHLDADSTEYLDNAVIGGKLIL